VFRLFKFKSHFQQLFLENIIFLLDVVGLKPIFGSYIQSILFGLLHIRAVVYRMGGHGPTSWFCGFFLHVDLVDVPLEILHFSPQIFNVLMLFTGLSFLEGEVSTDFFLLSLILFDLAFEFFLQALNYFLKLLIFFAEFLVLFDFLFEILLEFLIFSFHILLTDDLTVVLFKQIGQSLVFVQNDFFFNFDLVDLGILDGLFNLLVLAFEILIFFFGLSDYLFEVANHHVFFLRKKQLTSTLLAP
jgi:hypothetical protein